MKVKTLQQYLLSLVEPLQAVGADQSALEEMQRMNAGLNQFADKSLGQFAEFLCRSLRYEEEGHWPSDLPTLQGAVVDQPSIKDYADRLSAFLRGEVPSSGAMNPRVVVELNRLKGVLKLAQFKELAKLVGATSTPASTAKALEVIFSALTGRSLPEAQLEVEVESLRGLAGEGECDEKLKQMTKDFNLTQLKKIAKGLGITATFKTKEQIISALRDRLQDESPKPADIGQETSALHGQEGHGFSETKVDRIVEILQALKAKAEPAEAPLDEIEEELKRLDGEMSREEAMAVARKFGVIRPMNSRNEALQEIRWKLFEVKRARESIEY